MKVYLIRTAPRTMVDLKQQNMDFFSWWQNSCREVENTVECVKFSEYAKLLNDAILNNSICEEIEMC